jgi:hypothetical protein
MEATFFAVMFFGWEKVSKRTHLVATWMTGIGAAISAIWILVANSWMQHPVGMEFNPDTVRHEMVDFWALVLNPVAISKFFHSVFMCSSAPKCTSDIHAILMAESNRLTIGVKSFCISTTLLLLFQFENCRFNQIVQCVIVDVVATSVQKFHYILFLNLTHTRLGVNHFCRLYRYFNPRFNGLELFCTHLALNVRDYERGYNSDDESNNRVENISQIDHN